MPTLTFDQIHERVAAHHADEATRNAPKPAALRCVYELGSRLADLDAADRAYVLDVLREEILALPATA
jgi:hypothetical protein